MNVVAFPAQCDLNTIGKKQTLKVAIGMQISYFRVSKAFDTSFDSFQNRCFLELAMIININHKDDLAVPFALAIFLCSILVFFTNVALQLMTCASLQQANKPSCTYLDEG